MTWLFGLASHRRLRSARETPPSTPVRSERTGVRLFCRENAHAPHSHLPPRRSRQREQLAAGHTLDVIASGGSSRPRPRPGAARARSCPRRGRQWEQLAAGHAFDVIATPSTWSPARAARGRCCPRRGRQREQLAADALDLEQLTATPSTWSPAGAAHGRSCLRPGAACGHPLRGAGRWSEVSGPAGGGVAADVGEVCAGEVRADEAPAGEVRVGFAPGAAWSTRRPSAMGATERGCCDAP